MVIIAIPILLVFIAVRSLRQRTELWDQYMLTLDGDVLVLSQPGTQDSKLPLTDIISIKETKEGLFLGTRQGPRSFGVPRELNDADFEELRQILTAAVPDDEDDFEVE
jgi:hypothetical protein